MIKKTFPSKREPYGFLKLLTPFEKRGMEAAFFYHDINIPQSERDYIQPGLMMQFTIIKKPEDHMSSPVSFKALDITPVEVIEQPACVVRGPREHGKGIIVSLDYFPTNMHITAASWSELCASEPIFRPLLPGDYVVIRSTWREILQAAKEKRSPVAELVSRLERLPLTVRSQRLSNKHRSLSNPVLDKDTDSETGAGTPTTTAATHTAQTEEPQKTDSKKDDGKPTSLEGEPEENDKEPEDIIQQDVPAKTSSTQQQQQHQQRTDSGELACGAVQPVKDSGYAVDEGVQLQQAACLERQGWKRGGPQTHAPTERKRARSCGSGLPHQALFNQTLFTEELVRPMHATDVDESNPLSQRVSSPLHDRPFLPQFHSHCPAGGFVTCENGCSLPTWAQAGIWPHWLQMPFRGQYSSFPSRMTLADYIYNGGKL